MRILTVKFVRLDEYLGSLYTPRFQDVLDVFSWGDTSHALVTRDQVVFACGRGMKKQVERLKLLPDDVMIDLDGGGNETLAKEVSGDV